MTNIGVFDSGLGGLTVLSELVKNKKANYFYFGDSKRAPYGNRDKNELIKFSEEIVGFLETFDIDMYVIACNTMSVISTNHLTEMFDKTFIPISDAGIRKALEFDGDFLVLGTKTTVESLYYKKNIEKQSSSKVYEVKAGRLVGFIEDGVLEGPEMDEYLGEVLALANEKKIPNIILACTHFPIVKESIRNNLSYEANFINPAERILDDIDIDQESENKINIYLSDVNEKSEKIIHSLVGYDYDLNIKEL